MFRLGICGLAALAAGCSPALHGARATAPDLPLTQDDEAALGAQLHRELHRRGVRQVTDRRVLDWADGLFEQLTGRDRRDTTSPWRLHVIDEPYRVDAFSTPGGHVYVHSGLLRSAADEAEVAAVIAHELGHAAGRHELRHLVDLFGAGALSREAPAALADVARRYVAAGGRVTHAADEEAEADTHAMKLSASAGFAPRAIETFFEGLEARQPNAAWLERHPVTRARNANVSRVLAREQLEGDARNPERLRRVKRLLEPAAPVSSAASELLRFFGAASGDDELPDIERVLR